jgi:DNA-binding XRE family transcriptional regulator
MIRRNAGATLPEVAQIVGVTRQSVSYWESGCRRPRCEHLVRYAEVLRTLQEVPG